MLDETGVKGNSLSAALQMVSETSDDAILLQYDMSEEFACKALWASHPFHTVWHLVGIFVLKAVICGACEQWWLWHILLYRSELSSDASTHAPSHVSPTRSSWQIQKPSTISSSSAVPHLRLFCLATEIQFLLLATLHLVRILCYVLFFVVDRHLVPGFIARRAKKLDKDTVRSSALSLPQRPSLQF